MTFISFPFLGGFFSSVQTNEKIHCYHCDEKMKKRESLYATFNGNSYPVCCHGCLVVLQAIERNGMTKQYLQAKVDINVAESAG